jgi:hypothetical protein
VTSGLKCKPNNKLARKQTENRAPLGSLFDPEDGGQMFHQNVWNFTNCTALLTKERNLYSYRCEDLIFNILMKNFAPWT